MTTETQDQLFDRGPVWRRHVVHPCTPAPIGSGPAGRKCRECAHYRRVAGGARTYLKCGLMEHAWSGGPGSDIRAGWAACSEFDVIQREEDKS